jgi:hypothetical protein
MLILNCAFLLNLIRMRKFSINICNYSEWESLVLVFTIILNNKVKLVLAFTIILNNKVKLVLAFTIIQNNKVKY